MKLLKLDNLYFKLGNDFKGSLSDALRELADYHDEVKSTREEGRTDQISEKNKDNFPDRKTDTLEQHDSFYWDEFVDAINHNRRLFAAGMVLQTLEEGQWSDMDPGFKA